MFMLDEMFKENHFKICHILIRRKSNPHSFRIFISYFILCYFIMASSDPQFRVLLCSMGFFLCFFVYCLFFPNEYPSLCIFFCSVRYIILKQSSWFTSRKKTVNILYQKWEAYAWWNIPAKREMLRTYIYRIQIKWKKATLVFRIYKIWCFVRAFPLNK